jgi:ketosteroid isomerase-like protein
MPAAGEKPDAAEQQQHEGTTGLTRRRLAQAGTATAALAGFPAIAAISPLPIVTKGNAVQTAAAVQTDAMTDLKALNARFIHNFITNDVKSHDALLHPRFINMTSKGARVSRQDYLKRWATQFDPEVYLYYDIRDELITIFDNVALVRATNKATIRRDGTESTAMTSYTDAYLRENGEWKCIQAQITTVAPENYPGDETIVSVYIKGQRQN